MKIGLVCPYNISLGGGVQEVVFALQRHLTSRGHEVRIVTARPRRLGDIDTAAMAFIGSAIDLRWPNHTTAPLSSEINTDLIDDLLRQEQFDILHFHEPWVPVLSRQILDRSRSINIATFHAKVPETPLNRTLSTMITPYLRSALDQLHALTAVSPPAAEYVRTMTDRPVSIIPNGIELERFGPPDPSPRPRKTIVYIGRLERRKAVRYLLYAYKLLTAHNESVELVLAGHGPERRMLERLVQQFDIPRVTFLGYVSEAHKIELLKQADLFCSPAVFGESFGIVLLEAMASGVPVVAGANPGYSALLQGVGGLALVNPEDTPEFARRLQLFLFEPKLRNLWNAWARRYVRQFAYEKVARQYEAIYRQARR